MTVRFEDISDLQAESLCLGSVILRPSLLEEVFSEISPVDFTDLRHRCIASSVLLYRETYSNEQPLSLDLFSMFLNQKKLMADVGGLDFLVELVESAVAPSRGLFYAKVVQEKSIRRKVRDCGVKISEIARSDLSIEMVCDQSHQLLFSVIQGKDRGVMQDFKELLKSFIIQVEKNWKDPKSSGVILTGYKRLDDVLTGLHPSNLVVIGGRPSMGKTALALGIVQNISIRRKEKIGVGIFSLEMSRYEICSRLICAEALVSMEKVRKNILVQEDWNKLLSAAERMESACIFVDDSSSITLFDLYVKARKMVSRGASLIIVDYIQLMAASSGSSTHDASREQFVASISRGLKVLAKELEVPIIALSQLNRALESRTSSERRPRLSDIRESGSIEQDADVVCFVHRPVVYESEEEKREEIKNLAEIIVGKNRHGHSGDIIELYFHENFARFENLSANL